MDVSEQRNTILSGKLYCDFGDGYAGMDGEELRGMLRNGRVRFEADIPTACKAARFAPDAEGSCILYEVAVLIGGVKVFVETKNGTAVDNSFLFEKADPEIGFEIPENGGHIIIEYSPVSLHSDRDTAMESVLYAVRREGNRLKKEHDSLKKQNEKLKKENRELKNSMSWKVTKPARSVITPLKKKLKENPHIHAIFKGAKDHLWTEPKRALKSLREGSSAGNVHQGDRLCPFSEEELETQRKTIFPKDVRFSVVVPLYNTNPRFLREMIQSVSDQTYSSWELCLADGSDRKHSSVGRICKGFAAKNSRIKYRKLDKNLGISGNSNAALEMATGEYIALLDHDDRLHPAALFEVMRIICEQDADFIYTDEAKIRKSPYDIYNPNFKPDYAPDTLRTNNYICHLSVFSRTLLERAGGGFRSEYDGSQDYDLILRLTENAEKIVHLSEVLYYWRSYSGSTAAGIAAKPYTITAGKNAVAAHLQRVGLQGSVIDSRVPSMYHVQYEIQGQPLISILIPNKDHVEDLEKCVASIREKSTYANWEIIIIENNSIEALTFSCYDELKKDPRIQVVTWEGEFNYSEINNFGAENARGEYLLLLNNDVEVISPDWLEQMLMFSQRTDVGAVGAKLYYPDDTIQHAGVILGHGGIAGHAHRALSRESNGFMGRLAVAQNYSAVTGACMMVRRDVWNEVGGLDRAFKVGFNDVDFCMRIRQAGYLIVWTPLAELYHYESKSRGHDDTVEKDARFKGEVALFETRWKKELTEGDPYYNPNLALKGRTFKMREKSGGK